MRWAKAWIGASLAAAAACGTDSGQLGGTDPDLGSQDGGTVDVGVDMGPIDQGPLAEGQIRCELQTCDSERIAIPFQPVIDLPACCLEEEPAACGYDLTELGTDNPLADQLAQLELGCIPTFFEGELDPSCPVLSVDTGTVFGSLDIPGCCRDTGACGIALDLTNLGGPDFGCVPTSTVGTRTSTCGG